METVEQLAEELLEAVHAESTASEVDPGTVPSPVLELLEEKYTKLRAAFVALAGEDYLQSNGLLYMHFERHAREVMALSIDKTELNGLFAQRRSFAQDSINTGHDNSISIAVIENRIKTLLCLT